MSDYKIKVKEPWFTAIKTGKKPAEGRVNTGKHSMVKAGMSVILVNPDTGEEMKMIVSDVREYSTIREMLSMEGVRNMLPGILSIEHGIRVYDSFYIPKYGVYYESDYGVMAIEVNKD